MFALPRSSSRSPSRSPKKLAPLHPSPTAREAMSDRADEFEFPAHLSYALGKSKSLRWGEVTAGPLDAMPVASQFQFDHTIAYDTESNNMPRRLDEARHLRNDMPLVVRATPHAAHAAHAARTHAPLSCAATLSFTLSFTS